MQKFLGIFVERLVVDIRIEGFPITFYLNFYPGMSALFRQEGKRNPRKNTLHDVNINQAGMDAGLDPHRFAQGMEQSRFRITVPQLIVQRF